MSSKDLNIQGFKRDDTLSSDINAISFVSTKTEDDFLEVIEPSNNDSYFVVIYYKACSKVLLRLYNHDDNDYIERFINWDCEKIYGEKDGSND